MSPSCKRRCHGFPRPPRSRGRRRSNSIHAGGAAERSAAGRGHRLARRLRLASPRRQAAPGAARTSLPTSACTVRRWSKHSRISATMPPRRKPPSASSPTCHRTGPACRKSRDACRNASASREDKKLSEAEREPAVKQYGSIALNVLRRAVAGGYKDAPALQAMAELAALRDCPNSKTNLRS